MKGKLTSLFIHTKFINSLAGYNSYHSNLILLHRLNALPTHYLKVIPSSTLSSWKNKKVENILGCDELSDNDVQLLKLLARKRRLLSAAKSMHLIFSSLSKIFQQANNRKELYYKHRNELLSIVTKVKPIIGLKRTLKWMGLSSAKFYYWTEKKGCKLSTFELCQVRHPHQLNNSEIATITQYHKDVRFSHWSTLSIYYQAMREGATAMSLATWYKYTHRLGIKKSFYKIKPVKTIGIRAQKPFQVLHMDVTIFKPTHGSKLYIYFIIDNYSRAIVNHIVSESYSSQIALNTLKGAIVKNSSDSSIQLITDGGPENHGKVSDFIATNPDIEHLIAQKDIVLSNSMVESVNKHMKYHYLFRTKPVDFESTTHHLAEAVENYQNKPHGALFGLTPNEVLHGSIPTKNLFNREKTQARVERIRQNQQTKCCQK